MMITDRANNTLSLQHPLSAEFCRQVEREARSQQDDSQDQADYLEGEGVHNDNITHDRTAPMNIGRSVGTRELTGRPPRAGGSGLLYTTRSEVTL